MKKDLGFLLRKRNKKRRQRREEEEEEEKKKWDVRVDVKGKNKFQLMFINKIYHLY